MGNFLFHSFENVYATDLCPWYIYHMMAGFRRMFFPGGVPPPSPVIPACKRFARLFLLSFFYRYTALALAEARAVYHFPKIYEAHFQFSKSICKRAVNNHTCSRAFQAAFLLGRTSPCEEIPIYAGNRDSPFRRFRYYFVTL